MAEYIYIYILIPKFKNLKIYFKCIILPGREGCGIELHGAAAAGFDLGDAEAAEITNAELSEHGYRGGCEKCSENAPLIMPLKNV